MIPGIKVPQSNSDEKQSEEQKIGTGYAMRSLNDDEKKIFKDYYEELVVNQYYNSDYGASEKQKERTYNAVYEWTKTIVRNWLYTINGIDANTFVSSQVNISEEVVDNWCKELIEANKTNFAEVREFLNIDENASYTKFISNFMVPSKERIKERTKEGHFNR